MEENLKPSDPRTGGVRSQAVLMNGETEKVCTKFASFHGGFGYCGEGPAYQTPSLTPEYNRTAAFPGAPYVDCSGVCATLPVGGLFDAVVWGDVTM